MTILELHITAPGDGPGYAGRMFRALFDVKVNIELITTSEIRLTYLIGEGGRKSRGDFVFCASRFP